MLPPAVVEALDFSTLSLEPGTLVDPEHAELTTDLLYRVKLAAEDSFIYVLFEHQSSACGLMPYRMARYMLRIWERWFRTQEPTPTRLPVIVPLVLSNDERPWRSARCLRDVYAAPPELLDALGPHLLDLTLRIDDLPAESSEALRSRQNLHVLGRLSLLLLQWARTSEDLEANLTSMLDLLRELSRSERGVEDLVLIFRYAWHVGDFEPDRLRALSRRLGRQVEEAVMTTAERLKAEGRAEGKAEGKAEGQAQMLVRLLTLRFGKLPASALERIASARPEDLEQMAERVLSASTLDDIWG